MCIHNKWFLDGKTSSYSFSSIPDTAENMPQHILELHGIIEFLICKLELCLIGQALRYLLTWHSVAKNGDPTDKFIGYG